MKIPKSHIVYVIVITSFLAITSCSNEELTKNSAYSLTETDSLAFISHINAANSNRIKGDLDQAKIYADSARTIAKNSNWNNGLSEFYNTTSYINLYESDFESSMENALEALEISEANNDLKNQGFANLLIGYIHFSLGDTNLTLPYYKKSIKIRKQLNNDYDLAYSYSYMGSYFHVINEYDSAIYYHNLALKHRLKTSDSRSIADSYLLIGSSLYKQNNYNEAIQHFELAFDKYKEIKDKKRLAETSRNFAEVYLSMGDTILAEKYLTMAYRTASQIGALDNLIPIADQLALIKNQQKNYKAAYNFLRFHLDTKNKTSNNTKYREITKKILQYKIDKEKKIKELEDAQKEEKRQLIYIAITILVALLVLFLFFVFNRLKITRKQKEIIADKKDQVDKSFVQLEEKNKEILDSITYAKRIQSAILPSKKMIKKHLPNSFVLYKPKDIVAGDFYWMEAVSNVIMSNPKQTTVTSTSSNHRHDVILFAVADCTGHGVPGAMISVTCNNSLNRSVHEYGLNKPSDILDKTRELISKEFDKSEEDVKDGMDIALCSICFDVSLSGVEDKSKKNPSPVAMLQYAGANNPLWIIRKETSEIEEIVSTRQPIGKMNNPEPYINNIIQLYEGDVFYLFSDGYYDQFGGKKGKKYKSGNFKKLLISIHEYSMEKQRELLDEEFKNWKGTIEQIDDVCVIGVRI